MLGVQSLKNVFYTYLFSARDSSASVSLPYTRDFDGNSGIQQSLNLQLRDLFQFRREKQSFQAYSPSESL